MSVFNQLFSLRFGLSSETRILEMCGWDEDRATQIVELFSSAIESSMDNGDHTSKDDAVSSVANILSESLEEYEVEVLIEILEELVDNFRFIIDTNTEYEN
jgi:hypothetical protein